MDLVLPPSQSVVYHSLRLMGEGLAGLPAIRSTAGAALGWGSWRRYLRPVASWAVPQALEPVVLFPWGGDLGFSRLPTQRQERSKGAAPATSPRGVYRLLVATPYQGAHRYLPYYKHSALRLDELPMSGGGAAEAWMRHCENSPLAGVPTLQNR